MCSVFAPTRSGKGVGLVVPTLLTWPGSAIVHDIKGRKLDPYRGMAGALRSRAAVRSDQCRQRRLQSFAGSTAGRMGVRDAQNIADVLVDPEGALERRNRWRRPDHSLLVEPSCIVLRANPTKLLPASPLSVRSKRPIRATLRAMMMTPHLGRRACIRLSPAQRMNSSTRATMSAPASCQQQCRSSGLYRDPVVARVTRQCDWRICDLVEAAHPATLYLVVPPSDISGPAADPVDPQPDRSATDGGFGSERPPA